MAHAMSIGSLCRQRISSNYISSSVCAATQRYLLDPCTTISFHNYNRDTSEGFSSTLSTSRES